MRAQLLGLGQDFLDELLGLALQIGVLELGDQPAQLNMIKKHAIETGND